MDFEHVAYRQRFPCILCRTAGSGLDTSEFLSLVFDGSHLHRTCCLVFQPVDIAAGPSIERIRYITQGKSPSRYRNLQLLSGPFFSHLQSFLTSPDARLRPTSPGLSRNNGLLANEAFLVHMAIRPDASERGLLHPCQHC